MSKPSGINLDRVENQLNAIISDIQVQLQSGSQKISNNATLSVQQDSSVSLNNLVSATALGRNS